MGDDNTMNVVLYGFDGAVHAEGMVRVRIIADTPIVTRDGRHYSFREYRGSREVVYREVATPYMITEF